MVRAFLLLGSNEGNRLDYLEKAVDRISTEVGKVAAVSSVYETAPWGEIKQPNFLNQVVEMQTSLDPQQLLKTLLGIESSLGRVRTKPWGSRTIDIDILFYGNEVLATADLIIPHPAMALRRFTLVPLAELVPKFIHPLLKKNIQQILSECKDLLEVHKWKV